MKPSEKSFEFECHYIIAQASCSYIVYGDGTIWEAHYASDGQKFMG